MRGKRLLFIAALMASGLPAQEAKQEPAAPASADVVFRSEVSLVRVDVQVLDRNHNAITGLTRDAFALREEGRPREIRNFASEDMPVDILLLLDVSGSMRPNLERVAQASRRALEALSRDDRVSVMVFDRVTRVRLPFRSSREEVQKELDFLLDQERFNGGTDVRRALLDAARYVQRQARPAARRAIVIVTDDQTEFESNDVSVSRAISEADAVLSLLLAPAAMPRMTRGGQHPGGGYPGGGRRYPGGGYPGGGTTWPGGGWPGGTTWPGGGTGWPGGGGTRIPGGGGNGPVVIGGDRTHSAGTDEIARESGGDSLSLSEASAFEMTLQRIRQRYALHFLMPDGVRAGEQRSVDIKLASVALNRYPDARVRFRRYYTVPSGTQPSTPAEVTQEHTAEPEQTRATTAESAPPEQPQPTKRRRVAVSEPASRGPRPTLGGTSSTQP